MKYFYALAAVALAAPILNAQSDTAKDPWEQHDLPASAAISSTEPKPGADLQRQYPFRRGLIRADVNIRVKRIRLAAGQRISLVYGVPKKAKRCPAVFILDVEASALVHDRSFLVGGLSKKRQQEIMQAAYLTRSPFGSNLLGNGFAVAYAVGDDLDSIRSARTADWIGMLNKIRRLKEVDDDSFFLFSTREYANASIYLAANYNFAGFILEEPNYLLFSRNTFENVVKRSDRLTPEEIWKRTDPSRQERYLSIFRQIHSPIMLIRDKNSGAFEFNEKTLVPMLLEANAFVESVNLNGPTRTIDTFGPGNGVIELAPKISYSPQNVSLWLDEMIAYMRMNAATDAVALRDPANYRNR